MKKIAAAMLISLPLACFAEEVAINFDAIPLSNFVQSTYRAMLKRDYVISPELLASDRPISVAVRSLNSQELPKFVDGVLSAQGVTSEVRNGVYFLGLAAREGTGQTPIELSGPVGQSGSAGFSNAAPLLAQTSGLQSQREVYRPRNRKSDFMATVLNSAFQSKGAFAVADMVVLTGDEGQIADMLKLAAQVDEPVKKVRISATFVEVSSNDSRGLGVSIIANVLGARLGVKLGDTSANTLTLKTNNFETVIDAIASDGRFKQIAAPTAIVDDYERGNLSFGDSVPTVASSSLDRNGNSVQQIQYQQSGVLLSVLPSVLGSGRINVQVDGQISSFSSTTTGVSMSPTLSKRQVQTSVTVDDGELLLIGGLNSDKSSVSTSGISFLPKSLSSKRESSAGTDLVLVLVASVVQ